VGVEQRDPVAPPARPPARRPRVLFVNNTTYDLPLPAGMARGWDAICERMDVRVIGRRGDGRGRDPRFRLVDAQALSLAGRTFHLRLPALVTREIRRFRPDVVSAQSPYEAFASLPAWPFVDPRPRLLVQVHGDWRISSRLYGSRLRALLAPAADRAAVAGLRRADATRTVGPFTSRLVRDVTGREPEASYPTYFDVAEFVSTPVRPLPATPTVVWIGALERTKNLDRFVAAWRLVLERDEDARLVVIGEGRMRPLVDGLAREARARVSVRGRVTPDEVARALDESTALALPSRSEGTPRVVMEAFLRGRPVVGARAGGIVDLVRHDENGFLVDPEDPGAIARALLALLADRGLAERLAHGARESGRDVHWTADRLADELAALVQRMLSEPQAGSGHRPGGR
jgi:glycosyltransferase involved in cell wall biosynthesis